MSVYQEFVNLMKLTDKTDRMAIQDQYETTMNKIRSLYKTDKESASIQFTLVNKYMNTLNVNYYCYFDISRLVK